MIPNACNDMGHVKDPTTGRTYSRFKLAPAAPLSERIKTPGFRAEVGRARERLDAKDAGWNEGIEEAATLAAKWKGSHDGLVALIRDRLIPESAPPPPCGGVKCWQAPGGGWVHSGLAAHPCSAYPCPLCGGTLLVLDDNGEPTDCKCTAPRETP